MANGHRPLLLYKSYTCYTHGVKAFQELYSYTTLHSIQLYIAIHYTTSTTPSEQAQVAASVAALTFFAIFFRLVFGLFF